MQIAEYVHLQLNRKNGIPSVRRLPIVYDIRPQGVSNGNLEN